MAVQTIQLALTDACYSASLRNALRRAGPWRVVIESRPDLTQRCVVVLDEEAFNSLAAPIRFPERVVLIARKDPQYLSRAWDAGIVSVVSADDSPNTILLAIMAAALRVPKTPAAGPNPGGISPTRPDSAAPIPAESADSDLKHLKNR